MRYLYTIILLILFFSACKSDECTRTFSNDFGLSTLPIWEKQTNVNLTYRKNDSLISLFRSAAENNISFFERERFIKDILDTEELKNYKFDSLTVVEINTSGEVNLRRKYILVSCGKKTTIIKFRFSTEKWKFIQVQNVKTSDVDAAINSIINRTNNTIYWGSNINDLVAVSKFLGHEKISVEVFNTLSERQYRALSILENNIPD